MAAAKKTTDTASPVVTTDKVYGTVADAPGETVPVGERAEAVNLTGDGPDKPSDKAVSLHNPLGDSKITVSSDIAHHFEDAGYKHAK